MSWHFSLYGYFLLFSAYISAVVAYKTWERRSTPGNWYFSFLMVSACIWAVTGALEAFTPIYNQKIFFSQISYFGIVGTSPAWFCFAVNYAGYERYLSRMNLLILAIIPIVVLLAALTNDYHQLIWLRTDMITTVFGSFIDYHHGPLFYVLVIYLYLLNVGATLLLLGRFRRANPISKTQSIIILVASIFPWSGNIIYISGLALPMVDLTPVGFTLSGIIVLWSMTQHQLFRILPVARETLLSNMKELVIVLDLNSFILDMNASAQQMFGAYPLPIGKKSSEVFAQWPELFHSITSKEFAEKEIRILIGEHLVHWFEVRCTPFYNERNVLLGTLVVCRDVTVRKHQEMEREHMLRELQDAMANIKTLSGLLPICSSCKKIRNDKGYWQQVETYIMSHAEIRFTHGICPDCTDKLYGNYLKANKGPQKS